MEKEKTHKAIEDAEKALADLTVYPVADSLKHERIIYCMDCCSTALNIIQADVKRIYRGLNY
jgi:hypothetical protein